MYCFKFFLPIYTLLNGHMNNDPKLMQFLVEAICFDIGMKRAVQMWLQKLQATNVILSDCH